MKRTVRILVSVLAVVSLGLLFPLGLAGVRAQSGDLAQPLSSSPLVFHDPLTNSNIQIMPTTQYLADHGIPYGPASSGPTSGASGLSPSTCTLATDNSTNDGVVPLVNQPATQDDALDISAFGLSTSADGQSLTGQLTAVSLSDGVPVSGTPAPAVPDVTGGGDNWYVVWKSGTDPNILGYFVAASYPATPADTGYVNDATTSNLPVSFRYGYVTPGTGGIQTLNFSGAATGSFDVANNRITIKAPLSSLGSPKAGSALAAAYAKSQAAAGTTSNGPLFLNVDTVNTNSADYLVGQSGANCPGPKSTGGGSTGPVGNAPRKGTPNNMSYFGGPVVHTMQNHLIWWLPQAGTTTYSDGTTACTIPGTISYSYEQPASGTLAVGALPGGPDGDADYQGIIRQYFKDLGGTSFYNLLSQYTDSGKGITQNNEVLAGEWTDHCGYTSTPTQGVGPTVGGGVGGQPVPGGTEAFPVTTADIQAEVARAIQINHWPTGTDNEYFVFTGYGVSDCMSFPASTSNPASPCAVSGPNPYYCAYHGDFYDSNGTPILYADMWDAAFAANPAEVSLCYQPPIGVTDPTHSVNGNAVTDPIADAEVSITSHEEFETVNDELVGSANDLGGAAAPPLGWINLTGGEIGDICAYNYGNTNPADGSNITLHGDHYIVQQEQSNWNNGCAAEPYMNNASYGGGGDSIAIQKGWNVIGVPTSGITDTGKLVTDMTRTGQLPQGSITQVATFHGGKQQLYVPGKSRAITLVRTDGVEVYSTATGTYTPSGTLYTSGATITLNPGWNLVSTTWPNPGLSTDNMFNQIEAENLACSANILTNDACSPTISEIKITGPSSASPTDATNTPLVDWTPNPPDSTGHGQWPQTLGDNIPFTSGMWIYATKQLTWTVQGSQCQSVDSAGVCH